MFNKFILLILLGTLVNLPIFANNECGNAIELIPSTTCLSTSASFQGATFNGNVISCATNASQDIWYKFTATDSIMEIALGASSNLNHGFELIENTCTGNVILCRDNNGAGSSEGYLSNTFIPGRTYYIRVFNSSATIRTNSFTICVVKYPKPSNDACVNAIDLIPNTTCANTTGTFSGAMLNGNSILCSTSSSQDVWYKFTATDSTMEITLSAESNLNHGFELIENTCTGNVILCRDNNGAGSSEGYFSNTFITGRTYYVRVFNSSSTLSSRSFGICIRKYPKPSNDICANAIELIPNANCTYTMGTFSGAMQNQSAPSCAPNSSQDVWYKFTATDSTMSVGLASQTYLDHGFEIITGGCTGTSWQCINASSDGWSESYFNDNFIPGQEYYVRVFNVSSILSIRNFEICIRKYPKPNNDICANAIELTPNANCTYTMGTFSGAMQNQSAPSCAPNSSQDVWYKFTATDSTMSVGLASQTYLDHGFEIITGGCTGTSWQCINSSSDGFSENYFNNNFIPGQEYYVRVFNASYSLSTRNFEICVRKYPKPNNDICANAIELTPNASCTYTVGTFSGAMQNQSAPLCAPNSSQDVWYKFTATDSTMSVGLASQTYLDHGFEIITGGCAGTSWQCINSSSDGFSENYFNSNFIPGQEYYVRVFNASYSLSTRNFEICVRKYPKPNNDICANAIELTPNASCTYTMGTFSGAMQNQSAPLCAPSSSQDVWYKFTATDSTMSVVLAAESYLNHGFEIITGGCAGTSWQCINSSSDGFSENYFNNNFIPGQEYYVRVFNASYSLSTRSFEICVRKYPKPNNDICASAIELTPNASCTYIAGTFSGAMLNGVNSSCASNASQDVWYKFTATSNTMTVQLNAVSNLNHGFQVYQGSCTGTEIICRNSSTTGFSESYNFTTLTSGEVYYIRVINALSALSTNNFNICVIGQAPTNCTPTISINSSTTTICQGQSVTFQSSIANGGTTPIYQWKVDGINVGTNSNTYSTNNLANGSIISCVLTSNASCASNITVISNSITVNVSPLNTPTFNQVSAVCSGTSFNLPTTSTNGITGTWSPAINTSATTTYTFTPNVGQCANTTTMTVVVNSVTPTFNQVPAVCSGTSFSLPTTSVNGVTGTWSPAINTSATTTYTFTPNVGQCANTTTMTVTVNSGTVTPTFNQVSAVCSGTSFSLPTTSTNGITGTWSPAINVNATTTYTFTPNAGQCARTATMTVTINNTTVPTFNQIPAICVGDNFSLPTTSTNAVSGTWSPAINTSATTTYTFTPNAGQCASTTTMTVTVNAGTVVPTFNQVSAVCSGISFNLPTTSTNGITGIWSPAINTSATTTYTFTPNAGQCARTATMTVTINNTIAPIFNQIPAICVGDNFSLPVVSSNAISGTWSPAINTSATTTYTFTPNAGQCANTTTMTIEVKNVDVDYLVIDPIITANALNASFQWINCFDNNILIGETTNTLIAPYNGEFAVIVAQNGCIDTSACILITTVSVNEIDPIKNITVMPNPFSSNFTLAATIQDLGATVIISDITGRMVYQTNLQNETQIFDLQDVANGVYFIKLSTRPQAIKIVKF